MKKSVLLCVLLALIGTSHAASQKDEKIHTGPDCSDIKTDNFLRIENGILQNLASDKNLEKKYHTYINALTSKDTVIKKTRLSSEKISKNEARRLMMRRAKTDGFNQSDIEENGIKVQYLDTDLYRQYYLIESNKGMKIIAEYYTAVASKGRGPIAISCGADLENIYIISDQIYGHTTDFASR